MIDVQGYAARTAKSRLARLLFAPRCGPARRADRNPVLRHLPFRRASGAG